MTVGIEVWYAGEESSIDIFINSFYILPKFAEVIVSLSHHFLF